VHCRIWCSPLVVMAVVVWSWDVSCVHCVPETCWDKSLIINVRFVASCWVPSLHPIVSVFCKHRVAFKKTQVKVKVKVEQSLYRSGQFLRVSGSWGSQVSKKSAHEGGIGRLYPPGGTLVPISVRGWVDRRDIVRPEELCQWKIPVTLSWI